MQFTPTPEWRLDVIHHQRKFRVVLAELAQSVEECYFTWPVSYKLRRLFRSDKPVWIWCRHAPDDDWAIGRFVKKTQVSFQ
jgi:hypothetical protein